ncbi:MULTISPECIES: hypothetical protein [Enterococcus]|uniref:Uncharacterized protein n=1 Tax=Candidatus Enterococcus ferrettii TaxID=2815324 RepID=A0ABV0EP64_9ENTE|nr:hypothetical protein [Enterococcus sp. 665A]MBO1340796.1 hypothetical protein [Enterococcus sp. 665A]
MKKISGVYFKHPLDLSGKQSFEVDVSHDSLYAKDCSVVESNQLVLTEIAAKYQHQHEDLHSFFIIETIDES